MITLLIADDHAIFREGLRQILEDVPDMVVSGEASSGQEVLEKVSKNDYDLLLLDIAMPGLSGLETLKLLKSQKPKLRVLVLSMYPEEQYAVRAIKAGAYGYITKASASEELIGAIRKISGGGRYISASIAEKLLFNLDPEPDRPLHERLSDREYQVLCLIARGRTVGEIAEELCLSVKTVSTHRTHILEKMRLKSNAELTNYALKLGLVCLTD
ncbi:MAG: response regulator transcription factor [Deltaproteobacteria bacterium]|nr:response regulator transcription factor [Deltaproteobacteria bacterium]